MQAHRVRRTFGLGIVLALSSAAALMLGAPASAITLADPIGPRPARSPDSPAAPQSRALLDGFEDPAWPNPDLWIVSSTAVPTWWPSTCRARTGRRALWAFGGQVGAGEQACGAGAPLASSSSIVQRLDLRGTRLASRLELQFDLWMQLPPGPDTGLFIFLRVPQAGGDPKRVPIFGATGGGGDWVFPLRQLDLMNLADITDPREVYDLRGGIWELEWLALAPGGTAPGAGVFIDDVILAWEPDPAVTPPTPRPTGPSSPTPTMTATAILRTPTASATPSPTSSTTPSPTTPSATPTPTATRRATPGIEDTPTPRPTTAVAYLPWTAREEVLWTATPTPEGSETPTPATPEVPTATPTVLPKPVPLYLPWAAREFDMVPPQPTAEDTPPTGAIGDRRRSE